LCAQNVSLQQFGWPQSLAEHGQHWIVPPSVPMVTACVCCGHVATSPLPSGHTQPGIYGSAQCS
jgi:hypothetical protein